MNPRARRARRILRDHRRAPALYSHARQCGPFNVTWICPRCAGRRAAAPIIEQWRLAQRAPSDGKEVHAVYNYFEQARNIPAAQVEWLNTLGGEE